MPATDRLRLLPKVDPLLRSPRLAGLAGELPRHVVLQVVQEEVERMRELLRTDAGPPGDRAAVEAAVLRATESRLRALRRPTLRRVLNATGVVLHTNLGRSPLSEAATRALLAVARGYTNLEYDLERGERSSRMAHIAELGALLLGAEAVHAVNNNAAAVLLAIDTLGGPGVVVSRGELVEIGDGFRLPEILARARVPIHEIGTTNRTSPADYEAAAAVPGCVLLKVHRSNFTVSGFTREASVAELADVARRRQAIVVYDLGSGCVESLAPLGLAGEPDVRSALASGADLVTMSGDKLFGGPQAGLVAGRRALVDALRRNPLSRALRVDKFTLAALQATLLSYLSGERAPQDIPALRLILTRPADIEARARRLLARLEHRVAADLAVAPGTASVGGGSFADVAIPSFEVRVQPRKRRATEVSARLRGGEPAVVARIKDDVVALDMRCIADDDLDELARAVERACDAGGEEA